MLAQRYLIVSSGAIFLSLVAFVQGESNKSSGLEHILSSPSRLESSQTARVIKADFDKESEPHVERCNTEVTLEKRKPLKQAQPATKSLKSAPVTPAERLGIALRVASL